MVLSSSFNMSAKAAAASPELLQRAVEACLVVVLEVRRRVDALHSTESADLQRGLRAAEAALALSTRPPLLPGQRSTASTAGASSTTVGALSRVETQPPMGWARTAPSATGIAIYDFCEPTAKGSASKPSLQTTTSQGSSSSGAPTRPKRAATSSPPPLPARDENVSRPALEVHPLTTATGDAIAPGSSEADGIALPQTDGRRPTSSSSSCAQRGCTPSSDDLLPNCTAAQSAEVWGCVLNAVFWKRRKLTECALTAVELLLQAVPVPRSLRVTLVADPTAPNREGGVNGKDSSKACRAQRRSGRMLLTATTAIYYALTECLLQNPSEPSLQVRTLRLLSALVSKGEDAGAGVRMEELAGRGNASENSQRREASFHSEFRGHAAIRAIDACFSVLSEGGQDEVRREARRFLSFAVRRVAWAFVMMEDSSEGAEEAHSSFSTDTILPDYVTDVDHNEPYTWIHVVPSGRSRVLIPPSSNTRGSPQAEVAHVATCSADDQVDVATKSSGSDSGGSDLKNAPPGTSSRPSSEPDQQVLGTDPARSSHEPHPSHHSEAPIPLPMIPFPQAASVMRQPQRSPAIGSNGSSLAASLPFLHPPHQSEAISPVGVPKETRAASPLSHPDVSPKKAAFDPHTLFRSSVEDSLVLEALSTLNSADGALPTSFKDFLMLLRRMCRCASRPCSGVPNDANSGVRARGASLWVLQSLLDCLPVANCEQEHRCATWMSLALHSCKYELLGCLARNLAVTAPFVLFERAVHTLGLLLRKLHYHMARELHTLLSAFLLPLMSSPYAGFRQKHAVLSMLRHLFSVPHLCISFFVNYDCNPAFDPGAEYGGMLELLVEHVVETTFVDHVDENGEAYAWLSSDQQQLLRSESVVVIHTLMSSLHRWIAEDPHQYAEDLRRGDERGAQRTQEQDGEFIGTDAVELAELYLDNWDTVEAEDPHLLSGNPSSTKTAHPEDADGREAHNNCHGPLSHNVTLVQDTVSGSTLPHWGTNQNIEYHWKHVHYLLHDKRIAQEALQRVNAGQWRDAKAFLERRGFMAVSEPSSVERDDPTGIPAGTSSYALFARFLYEYPGVSRDALSRMFEKVNQKDGASRLLLREYLHCFLYKDVPVDVAMRDTTCRFMSWERPMFEAAVWETIQQCFGEEYAKQNPQCITARDADVMAGVLLFLHSNLHNKLVKNDRMTVDQFVRDANACLEFPMMKEDLRAMFERIRSAKWELDAYGRTPQQVEKERTLMRLSAKIQKEREAKWWRLNETKASNDLVASANGLVSSNAPRASGQTDRATEASANSVRENACSKNESPDVEASALEEILNEAEEAERGSTHSSCVVANTACPPPATESASSTSAATIALKSNPSMFGSLLQMWMSNDAALLDGTIPSYTTNRDSLKIKDEQHQAFHEVASVYLHNLEAVHLLYCTEEGTYHPQPYIVPHYAEHVRQIILLIYPHVMSCVYMGFRILEEFPIVSKLLDTLQLTYDIAAAFVLNLRDLRPAMEEVLQRYLNDEQAYRLLPSSRATFIPFLMNII